MKHQTKDKIIRCAIRLMQEQGYSNLGLREFALEIGIKAPSLYNHFKSKTELAQVALFTYRELQLTKLNHINQLDTLINRFRAYIALFNDMLIDEGYICFAMILTLEKKTNITNSTGNRCFLYAKYSVDRKKLGTWISSQTNTFTGNATTSSKNYIWIT